MGELFHVEDPYLIETSPLISSANQCTGFYMIETSITKELKVLFVLSSRKWNKRNIYIYKRKWEMKKKLIKVLHFSYYRQNQGQRTCSRAIKKLVNKMQEEIQC